MVYPAKTAPAPKVMAGILIGAQRSAMDWRPNLLRRKNRCEQAIRSLAKRRDGAAR
jgi:hypothetical protein